MPRAIGIDPGTISVDVWGIDDGRPFLDESLPTAELARDPARLLRLLPADTTLIAGPSGYGLPLLPIERVGERELWLAFLPGAGGHGGVGGLRALIEHLREAHLPVVLTPGVIHLASVPAHRKVNRIDLGTADKVCAAAWAIADQAQRLRIPLEETRFVLVELGGAFSAVLAVEGGRIIDGQGGSSGPLGYLAGGAMDAEVACLLGSVDKRNVFSGGAAYVAGAPEQSPEELLRRDDERARLAVGALVESIHKAVAAQLAVLPQPREILLSGRLSRLARLRGALVEGLGGTIPVRLVGSRARRAKVAAQGAALIADGLAGGRWAALVERMGLREAGGTVLDHLFVVGTRGEPLRSETWQRSAIAS